MTQFRVRQEWTSFAVLLTAFAAGCAHVPPDPQQAIEYPEKAAWKAENELSDDPQRVIAGRWWEGFGSPTLNELVDRALADNLDLELMRQRVALSRATLDEQERSGLPTIGLRLFSDTQKIEGLPTLTTFGQTTSLAWELDLWGKTARGVQAQQADYQASIAEWRGIRLSVAADVVNRFVELWLFDDQVAQQQKAIEQSRLILADYQAQFSEGIVSGTRVRSQQAELHGLNAGLLDLQRQRRLAANALAILVGVVPGEPDFERDRDQPELAALEVPSGLPSELLDRRPDLIAARYRIYAADSRHELARLDRLPSFSLTGQAGSSSNALSKLLETSTFGISPSINLPILDPSIGSRIEQQAVQLEIAKVEYKQAVMQAFREVEDALTSLRVSREQAQQLRARRDELRLVSDHTLARLREGMVSQLEVFEVERTLLDAERSLAANQAQLLQQTVTLIKALGGGWNELQSPQAMEG